MNRIRAFHYVWETRYSPDEGFVRELVRRMRIPDGLLLSIVYLFRSREDAGAMQNPLGSGFITSAEPDFGPGGFPLTARYVVTNAHVVAGDAHFVRLNAFQEGQPVIRELRPDQWHRHWDGDVAVAFLEYAAGQGSFGYHAVEPRSFIREEIVRHFNIGTGDQAFMLGLFAPYYGRETNEVLPAARFGNVAMMPAQRIRNGVTGLRDDSYLVEMYSMGGFSGSPVFVRKLPFSAHHPLDNVERMPRPSSRNFARFLGEWFEEWKRDRERSKDRIFLLGINWGHLPESLPIRRQGASEDEEGLYARGNHSIGCVVPATKIAELLMDKELAEHREQLAEEEVRRVENDKRRMEGGEEAGAIPDALPFPDSGFTPGLQRTLKDKLERDEVDEVDEDAFFGAMRRAAPPEQDDEEP